MDVHSTEDYIASAMLDLFVKHIHPSIYASKTGILIVANVPHYAMKYMRRYNKNNVDLNRNIIAIYKNVSKEVFTL